jgi:hypothetical protein
MRICTAVLISRPVGRVREDGSRLGRARRERS